MKQPLVIKKENVMREYSGKKVLLALLAATAAMNAQAFDSGSTGALGAFNPTVNTVVTLPDDGVLHYTTINIPAGVWVSFKGNRLNTPVTLLASGNITINGYLNLTGSGSPAAGTAGDGKQGDDGLPGGGGPGGYAGGRGGKADPVAANRAAGAGRGPGGGGGGIALVNFCGYSQIASGGSGGGYASASTGPADGAWCGMSMPAVGAAYGANTLLPLIGGSGGGGGAGGANYDGSGGGGGGGAVLIASSGTLSITSPGYVLADGGGSGTSDGAGGMGGTGGGGSGGAIRLVATTISGNGGVYARGAGYGAISNRSISPGYLGNTGGAGAPGRIRVEAENITLSGTSDPAYTTDTPGPLFVASVPSLRIARVAGVDVPAMPTGSGDVSLPTGTANPVTVEVAAANIPVGSQVKLTVQPAYGNRTVSAAVALAGSDAASTASLTVTLPTGPSVLLLSTTYTVVAAVGDALSRFAGNERVEKVELQARAGQPNNLKLITVGGREFSAPPEVMQIAALAMQRQLR